MWKKRGRPGEDLPLGASNEDIAIVNSKDNRTEFSEQLFPAKEGISESPLLNGSTPARKGEATSGAVEHHQPQCNFDTRLAASCHKKGVSFDRLLQLCVSTLKRSDEKGDEPRGMIRE